MKATLKHVANQYILIVDERPRHNEWWYHPNGVINNINNELNDPDYNDCWRIIAAENLNGVKRIKVDFKRLMSISDEEFISLIDTEVEVKEREEYWVVRL